MSDSQVNEAELRALIELERHALVDPGKARARLATRLALQSGGPAMGARVPRWMAKPWSLRLLAGAAMLSTGGAAGYWARGERPARVEVRYVERVVPAATAPEVTPQASSTASVPLSVASAPSTPLPRPSSSSRTPRTVSGDDLARERQIIHKARSALARRDGAAGLAAVEEHAQSFPHGQFTEVREALAVQALVQMGQSDQARQRAARFHAAFPDSTYGGVVDDALSKIP